MPLDVLILMRMQGLSIRVVSTQEYNVVVLREYECDAQLKGFPNYDVEQLSSLVVHLSSSYTPMHHLAQAETRNSGPCCLHLSQPISWR